MKKKTRMTVVDSRMLTPEICSLTLRYPQEDAPDKVLPGQFAGLYTGDASMLLPRPISICRWDTERKELRFVFRIAGKGTRALAGFGPGCAMDMLGILGNGYPMEKLAGKRVLLLGGGIGVPPMLELAAQLTENGAAQEVTAVLGYRDGTLFLYDDFEKICRVLTATEDGSAGTAGNVLDAVRAHSLTADVICACGPLPMLRAVKAYAQEHGMQAFISLEERMACGVGACLGCVTPTKEVDAHSHVRNARICTEGPVFDAREVEIG